jgi:[protein-PII] uridylyltransferase
VFAVQDFRAEAFGLEQERTLENLKRDILGCLEKPNLAKSNSKNYTTRRHAAFKVEPFVLIDNSSSDTDTVIEISGLDRQGLLADLAQALNDEALNITSAHIGGIGERAQDAFYVRTIAGLKLEETHRQERLKIALYDVLKSFEPDAPTIVSKRKLARARASTRR